MRLFRHLSVAAAFCSFAAIAGAQHAHIANPDQPAPLPYFDMRMVDDVVIAPVREAIAEARSGSPGSLRDADKARLEANVHGVRISEDGFSGTPHFIRSSYEFLTAPAPGQWTPLSVTSDFIAEYPNLFEISTAEIVNARITRDFVTRHNGVTHLTLQQQINGIDVWGLEIKANVTAQGELINISSTMLPRTDAFAVATPQISQRRAIINAAANVGIELVSSMLVATGQKTATLGRNLWQTPPGLRADTPLSTRVIYFPLDRNTIHPAWEVVIAEPGIGNTYEVYVDASDGTILRRFNRLVFAAAGGSETATYNVFPLDSPAPGSPGEPTPAGMQFPEVPREMITVGATAGSPEGWIPDGANETLGNNCDAHLDLDANNAPDLPRPQGSPSRVFDFPLDLTQPPSAYQDAAVTQLFYYMNVIHDKLYEFGFDETAGNFQTDNFGLGGVGGDPVLADAQDGSGVNNANWSGSGTDGTETRVQMFVFDSPTPDRDGDLDGDVVYHEYAHGLSIRLSGGSVFGEQSGGMGEGWGDFFGIAMNAETSDDPDAVYPMGGYITKDFFGLEANYYFGIRRYPYSTDFSKSPLTYADIDPAQFVIPPDVPNDGFFINNPADEVHNVGEIWCQALLECRAELWNNGLGFAANDLLMQLVVDGMKLMPGCPNMLEARDAILSADLANNGGANLQDLWAGFAKRGMGNSATSPPGNTTSGIVEAFDTPPLLLFEYPAALPTQLHPEVTNSFPVTISGLGDETPIDGTGMLHFAVNGGAFEQIPMQSTGVNEYLATLPPANCFDVVEFYVSTDSSAGIVTDPQNAPDDTNPAEVFTSVTTLVADELEADSGWTVGAGDDDATTGIWERGDPNGTAAQPEDDNTEVGTDCFFTGQGAVGGGLGDNDVDGGKTTLFSPSFALAGTDARISYWRWYSNNTGAEPGADIFEVDVSANGAAGPWVSVEVVGPSGEGTTGGWIQHEFVLSDFVSPSNDVMLRFVASDEAGGSLVEAAVDDLLITEVNCDPTCQPDIGFGGPGDLSLTVCGPPLETGATNDLTILNGEPDGFVFLLAGFTSDPTPFQGGTLVPLPPAVIINLPLDATGAFTFPINGGDGPATLFLQAVGPDALQVGGFEFSSTVQAEFLP